MNKNKIKSAKNLSSEKENKYSTAVLFYFKKSSLKQPYELSGMKNNFLTICTLRLAV